MYRKKILSGFVGIFIFITTGQAANYDTGVFEFQQKLAKNGNPQAQYKLATMYENGRGTTQNLDEARSWYKKSGAKNYKPAKQRLTFLDIKRSGFKQSHKAWYKTLRTDAKQGNPEALYILGEMNEFGIGVKKNLKKARVYFKEASVRGNVDSEHHLYGVEAKINQAKADKLAKQEADLAAKEKQQKKIDAKARKELEAKKKKAQSSKKKQTQIKAAQERSRLEEERQALEEEKRKLAAQQKALAKREAMAAEKAAAEKVNVDKKPAKAEAFESDLCSGRAARFRTQCK